VCVCVCVCVCVRVCKKKGKGCSLNIERENWFIPLLLLLCAARLPSVPCVWRGLVLCDALVMRVLSISLCVCCLSMITRHKNLV
jgi:hypothetical protein